MTVFFNISRLLVLLSALAGGLLLSGCETTDPDNASVRPWNSPKSWENGLPTGLTEGR